MLKVADRLEIQELYARYCHAVDAFDGPAWADCFTPDGVMYPATGIDAGSVWRGRDALEELGKKADREARSRHWTSNLVLRPVVDHVEGRCYGMRIDISGERAQVISSVVYQDEIVMHDGRWLFRSRRPLVDVENRLADLGPVPSDG
jgi:hypothetical protein